MSLFEKLNNKRYDLQEKKKRISSSASSGNNNSNKNISTIRRNIRKAIADLDATQPQPSQQTIQTGRTTYNNNKKIDDNIGQKRTRETLRRDQINRQYGIDGGLGDTGGSEDGLRGGSSQTSTKTKTKTVKQSEVSQKAKDFTKKINKNRVKYDRSKILQEPEYYKQKYDQLATKRKEYGFTKDPKTKQFTPSKEGIKRYATKSAQLSSGSNIPVKVTKKQLATAKVNMTKKYGGRGGEYKAPTKTFAQIKAELADKKADKKLKSATRKIEKKFAKELPAKQKLAKTFAPATKADRQFFKATTRVTNPIVKKFAPGAKPVVKKVLKGLTRLGTPGRIAGAAGLALLSPGVRKTAVKVATGAGLGAGLGALAPKPKKPIAPTVKKVGINLSQNA